MLKTKQKQASKQTKNTLYKKEKKINKSRQK